MAQLRTHKFVASLPAELEADAIYYVRTGAGFDQYVTNHSGTIVAYPLNQVGSSGAPLDSPAFTGTPTAPTQTAGNNTTRIATTAFVTTAVASKANLASPAFTGTPTAPTPAATTNSTQIATTAWVRSYGFKGYSAFVAGKPLASEVVGAWTPPSSTSTTDIFRAYAKTAATASTAFMIYSGTTLVATATFSAGATIANWSTTGSSYSSSSMITLVAPATPDATLADIAFFLGVN